MRAQTFKGGIFYKNYPSVKVNPIVSSPALSLALFPAGDLKNRAANFSWPCSWSDYFMGWGYALQAHFKMLQILGISYTYVNLAVPVGCLLMTVHLTSYAYHAARGVWTNQYAPQRIGFAGTGAIMPEDHPSAGRS